MKYREFRDLKLNLKLPFFILLITLGIILAGCGGGNALADAEDDVLRVVASTTIVGDVIKNIAGDTVDLTVLLEPGQNPHSYQPAPMDMVAVTEADLIIVSGFGLEEFLDALLAGSETTAELVVISDGIDPLVAESHNHEEDVDQEDHEDDADDDYDGEDDHLESLAGAMGLDPHVWFDPNNVLVWVENISSVLGEINPSQADHYKENAAVYNAELIELDLWIHQQIDAIPVEHRELVTDHTSLGYFARQYDLVQIGAVIPALTTEAETSGMELADLIDTIEEHQARAVFVGVDFDQTLAQRVAEEAGVPLVPLYFGSLSVGDPAGTYLDFMRYNVKVISEALD